MAFCAFSSIVWERMERGWKAADTGFPVPLVIILMAHLYTVVSRTTVCALCEATPGPRRSGRFASLRSIQGTCPCERLRALPPPLPRLSSEKRISFTYFLFQINANAKQNVPNDIDLRFSACYDTVMKRLVPVLFGGSYAQKR